MYFYKKQLFFEFHDVMFCVIFYVHCYSVTSA